MKTILIAVFCALSAFAASAQVIYNTSGSTYTQNFNSLSQDTYNPGSAIPLVLPTNSVGWTDNSTLLGWYANQDTYTTAPTLLGLSLVNQMTSAGTGSDRALGSYLGTVALLNPITYGVRIKNNTGSALTSFNMSFMLRDFTTGIGTITAANVLDSFNLSYSTNATDVSGAGATNYNVIGGSSNLIGLNILNTTTDSTTVGFTVNNINVAQGSDLWIRFDRTGLLGVTDNSIGIDNVTVSAVPEPTTYMMLFLGLIALFGLKKLNHPHKSQPTPKIAGKTALLVAALSILSISGLSAQSSFTLKTDTENRVWMQSEGVNTQVPEKALRAPFSGAWGKCTVSRGVDSEGVPMIIVTMAPGSQATSFTFNDSTVKSPAGKSIVLYPLGTSSLPEINVVGVSPGQPGSELAKASEEPKPIRADCKYQTQKDSMIVQDDFYRVYGESVKQEKTTVIDSSKCLKTIDNYLVAMTQEPPPSIWIRNESYIQNPSASRNMHSAAGPGMQLLPITRPDQLMPELNARDLFSSMSVEQYHGLFYNMLPEMEKTSEQIKDLLVKWDAGTISQQEMQTLQSVSKIVWMVRCNLIDDRQPYPNGALTNSIMGAFQPNLSPEASTPFLSRQ